MGLVAMHRGQGGRGVTPRHHHTCTEDSLKNAQATHHCTDSLHSESGSLPNVTIRFQRKSASALQSNRHNDYKPMLRPAQMHQSACPTSLMAFMAPCADRNVISPVRTGTLVQHGHPKPTSIAAFIIR